MAQVHLNNFVVCPFSIHTLLGFLYYCGKNETAEQISDALYLPNQRKKIPEVFRNRIAYAVLKEPTPHIFTIVNMLCLRPDFEIKDIYKRVATGCFGIEIYNVNFHRKGRTALEISKWVKKKTRKRIKDVINETDIPQHTYAILISGVSFQGRWRLQFPKRNTKEKRFFFKNPKQTFSTKMMEVTDYFNYSENERLRAQFLEIPYEENDITMTIVLPTISFQMGIFDAFTTKADFSKVTKDGRKLRINSVIQKTELRIGETGQIVPSSTQVFSVYKEVFKNYKSFIADHQFLYFIKSSAGILFIGKYCLPPPS
ncbi:hypothetical protein ILUMI_22156 [Ignelater luminosus]|uniref:Serpin domain-containing protein n=1 Tax=Ignelater luminosus TaxID=2038154 RepID=A0A8K0G369_IGNLU|nr:hypothetical protein ILUMI_22156 [Ignelater luminosus]